MYLCMNLLYTITWSRWTWIHNEHEYPDYSRNSQRINSAKIVNLISPNFKTCIYIDSQRVVPLAPLFKLLGSCFPRARYERNSYIAGKDKCNFGVVQKGVLEQPETIVGRLMLHPQTLTKRPWKQLVGRGSLPFGFRPLFKGYVQLPGCIFIYESKVIQQRPLPFAKAHLHSPPTTGLELEKRRLKRLDKELEAAQWLWCKSLASNGLVGWKSTLWWLDLFYSFHVSYEKKPWLVGLI